MNVGGLGRNISAGADFSYHFIVDSVACTTANRMKQVDGDKQEFCLIIFIRDLRFNRLTNIGSDSFASVRRDLVF